MNQEKLFIGNASRHRPTKAWPFKLLPNSLEKATNEKRIPVRRLQRYEAAVCQNKEFGVFLQVQEGRMPMRHCSHRHHPLAGAVVARELNDEVAASRGIADWIELGNVGNPKGQTKGLLLLATTLNHHVDHPGKVQVSINRELESHLAKV
jgi:hypothetical protein